MLAGKWLSPNAAPPEPSSEICGKNIALATPILALATTSEEVHRSHD
jgi:hypothetical protein